MRARVAPTSRPVGPSFSPRVRLLAAKPELDRMSLRVAYSHHQARVSREAEDEARALSAVGTVSELWG